MKPHEAKATEISTKLDLSIPIYGHPLLTRMMKFIRCSNWFDFIRQLSRSERCTLIMEVTDDTLASVRAQPDKSSTCKGRHSQRPLACARIDEEKCREINSETLVEYCTRFLSCFGGLQLVNVIGVMIIANSMALLGHLH